ncbi:serine protease-like protein [Podospora didyma]|uniref:Serine protease-like protein n=1 Tax=Podospora didyma TaxID=330526 RepID=A0AAE0N169_9PEZI|nr:serine protease-like protein [Podospora didyma]
MFHAFSARIWYLAGTSHSVLGDPYVGGKPRTSAGGRRQSKSQKTKALGTNKWQATVEAVVKAVVSIKFCFTSPFDTRQCREGGRCIFDNHEEVDAYPVYRDPLHDFGILKFDPKAIKYMPVDALALRPDCASDFNTCYCQASAAAGGGSSGSPVVNINGYAVALQTGGRADGASTDYFLPLDRPLRALKCLQDKKPITRGDIQCQFLLKPLDECRRLGLGPEWEAQMRKTFPKETNMLVAQMVLPDGPSHGKVEVGDVLVKVNDEMLTQFSRFDAILDSLVGETVTLLLSRRGEKVEVQIEIGDLHKITPDRFVSVSGGIFHDLSYLQALRHGVACNGVYVCEAGGSWRFDSGDNNWLVQSIDHKETPDIKTFIEVMQDVPDKARVVVAYKHLRDLHTLNTAIMQINSYWTNKMKLAVRSDRTGLWDFSDLADTLPLIPPVPTKATFITLKNIQEPAVAKLIQSLVYVSCNISLKADGFPRDWPWGMGLVIDADKGLVVTSRAIVPHNFCDITITIAESIHVAANILFLHPHKNYAIIQYDPKLVDASVLSAQLSSEEIAQGASTYFIGFNESGRIVHALTTATDIFPMNTPHDPGRSRYRAVNIDAIKIDTKLSESCGSGVLVAQNGTNSDTGGWFTYYLGLTTPTILYVVRLLRRSIVPKLRMLPVEFEAITMSEACDMGVFEHRITQVYKENTTYYRLFMVIRRAFEQEEKGDNFLRVGDILLTLNGNIVTEISGLDDMYSNGVLEAVIVRKREELVLNVPTIAADDVETARAILFCGATIHRPHHAVRQQNSKLFSEVYVSAVAAGSPSHQYQLPLPSFITHVDGEQTPDLDSFLAASIKIQNGKCMSFDGVAWVIAMKKNDCYFTTMEVAKDPAEASGFRCVTYDGGKVIVGEGT